MSSPDRLDITCETVAEMVNTAYAEFSDSGPVNRSRAEDRPVRGGPAWIYSDRYTIRAKGEAAPDAVRRGPMLRALLEDRLHLKVHNGVEKIQMYALTIAKSGLKLRALENGACREAASDQPFTRAAPGEKPWCNVSSSSRHGPNQVLQVTGMTFGAFAHALSFDLGQPVIDETGIEGLFSFRLEYVLDEAIQGTSPGGGGPRDSADGGPPSDIIPGPSIFAEVEHQLGLRLASEKGPHGFLVIDKVERPSEN